MFERPRWAQRFCFLTIRVSFDIWGMLMCNSCAGTPNCHLYILNPHLDVTRWFFIWGWLVEWGNLNVYQIDSVDQIKKVRRQTRKFDLCKKHIDSSYMEVSVSSRRDTPVIHFRFSKINEINHPAISICGYPHGHGNSQIPGNPGLANAGWWLMVLPP